jgi:hypothetical protein
MLENRFTDDGIAMSDRLSPPFQSGFLLVPVAAEAAPQTSSLQWFYQQMYAQALQANQPSRSRDLFSIMN